ncbi:MAG: hypothetical protein V1734_02410 [Nanoarchaeota archaeon]
MDANLLVMIAYVEITDNLSRAHVAKKAAEYGLVKRECKREEISLMFAEPPSDMPRFNKLIREYHSTLEKLMDTQSLTGYQRPAFLAAEALGMQISQKFSFVIGNVVIERGNTRNVKIDDGGYQLILPLNELEGYFNKAVDGANFSDEVFHKKEFEDWLKKSISASLRDTLSEELPVFYLFDHIYVQADCDNNLSVRPIR